MLNLIALRKVNKTQNSSNIVSKPVNQGKSIIIKTDSTPSSYSICTIGVSTGGPEALNILIPNIPEYFRIPVLVVQHMPPLYNKSLSENLDKKSKLKVIQGGAEIQQGFVYIASTGKHKVIRNQEGKNMMHLNHEPPENSCRPSVDVLFRSAAEVFGNSGVLAVVLTGMGIMDATESQY